MNALRAVLRPALVAPVVAAVGAWAFLGLSEKAGGPFSFAYRLTPLVFAHLAAFSHPAATFVLHEPFLRPPLFAF